MTNSIPLDAVLIDDDSLVHMAWQIMAKKHGKTVRYFKSPHEFLSAVHELSKSVPVYIDSTFPSGHRGELVAKEIYAMGFAEIYLTTGKSPQDFSDLPWIKKIIGKDAPWGM